MNCKHLSLRFLIYIFFLEHNPVYLFRNKSDYVQWGLLPRKCVQDFSLKLIGVALPEDQLTVFS